MTFQNRLNNNITQYSGYCSAALAWKFNKHFKLTGGYVAGGKRNSNGNYDLIQQAFAGFMLRLKLNKLSLVYRNLTQIQIKGIEPLKETTTPTTFNRNKFTLKYELNKRWQVYTAVEIYLTLTNMGKYDVVGKTRNMAGLSYKIAKKTNLEPYFLFQRKSDYKNTASRDFIYGLTLNKAF